MDFIIDTEGDQELLNKDEFRSEVIESDFTKVDPDSLSELLKNITVFRDKILSDEKKEKALPAKACDKKNDQMIDDFFVRIGWGESIGQQTFKEKLQRSKQKFQFDNINFETGVLNMEAATIDVDKEMKKSVLKPGLEKLVTLPEYNVSDRRLKIMRKREREKSKGPAWFNLPAPEVTEEIKNDLQILKMRSVLDPKHFYKKNDMEVLPKYFQIGKVMDSALDHHNVRLTRKERKQTIVDELLADAEFNRYNRKKYKDIIEEKRKTTYKTHMKDKRLKSKAIYKQNKKEGKISKKKSKTR